MPKDAFITLKIFDLLGREVRTLVSTEQKAGFHLVIWDGKNNQGNDVSGGAYIYRFVAGEYTKTMKLLLLK
jgi:flagellar hook assembly protein FlgD